MIGLGLSLTLRPWAPSAPAAPAAPVTALFLGQSETEMILSAGSGYRLITQPTPGDGNLIVWTQSGNGVAPVRTVVNATTVAAGEVNPAMAAASALLAYVAPGVTFHVGDAAVSATGRVAAGDDAVTSRLFSDIAAVVDGIETETGLPLDAVIECWFNADRGYLPSFKAAFWPLYFGSLPDGSSFTLGSAHAAISADVDHCLWDGQAASDAKGRGLFARDGTAWAMLAPMPFWDEPVAPDPEASAFTQGNQMDEPLRETLAALTGDTLATSVRMTFGPSAHVTDFSGTGDEHPLLSDPDGQILFMWPFAMALLRASGRTIGAPVITGISGPENGAYVDVAVSLPNGGTLTTLRAFRGDAMPVSPSPHQQAVTGFEIARAGTRHPLYNESETSYDADFRGSIAVTDSGSGSPRTGTVRITPTNAFAYGDAVSYLRGQVTAGLLRDRDLDNKLFLDMLIEHVPSLYDSGALYPFEGLAVTPWQADLAAPVPAPPFVARSALFDSTDRFYTTASGLTGASKGLISLWLRHTGTWASGKTIIAMGIGGAIKLQLATSSSGRLYVTVAQDGSGTDLYVVPNDTFTGDAWHHVLIAFDYANARLQYYVNGAPMDTSAYSFTGSTKFEMDGASLNFVAFGCGVGPSQYFGGDIGHLYVNIGETLDLTVAANREKFALAGSPVSLGDDGSTPTGSAPQYYYNGDAGAGTWVNHGSKGTTPPLTGTLTAGGTPGY